MKSLSVALIAFVVLTLIFATISVWEYTEITNRITTSSQSTSQATSPSAVFPKNGFVEIDARGTRTLFTYMKWNESTPSTFKFQNVEFALSINTTITNSGSNCWVAGYGMYKVTFPDGSSETLSPCTLVVTNPGITVRFTNHINPQAGLLIVLSSGDVYFLVSV